jgi:hypothetical protein
VAVVVSVGTLGNERARWKAALPTRNDGTVAAVDEAPPSEPPEELQFSLPERVAPESGLPDLAGTSPSSAADAPAADASDEDTSAAVGGHLKARKPRQLDRRLS